MHFLLRHVHVPDINMDFFECFPSGCENIVMMPWQWIPPPPMTPPRPLSATPGAADHVGLLPLGTSVTLVSYPQVSRFVGIKTKKVNLFTLIFSEMLP